MSAKICLCMIVRNESKIIIRCLNAAKFAFSHVSICDTGSTDNTPELINTWLKENNFEGKVHNHVWKNFGHNRTESIKAAKETFPDVDFLLFLDADMCLVNKGFDKSLASLNKDCYLLTQTEGPLSYRNVRLVKAKFNWRSVGVTHEYFEADGVNERFNLDTLYIADKSDGGCKSDKLDRDASLLIQGINDEPNNPRYYFYLAQTYASMGHHIDAIHWYNKRIEAKVNIWEEETFYAIYRVAQEYEAIHEYEQAIFWYLKAYNRRPHRAEPLVKLSHMLIMNDKLKWYSTGLSYAIEAVKIEYPNGDLLFIEDIHYSYLPWYYISIAAYYVNKLSIGKQACEKVLSYNDVPDSVRQNVKNNYDMFYNK
jgi:glycosyltransferase involved in cell wall biosynthesis